MSIQHKSLAAGRWEKMSLSEQMANIGSEIQRTVRWKQKGKSQLRKNAFIRGLELIDMTINDKKNRHGLKEILRVREALVDHFVYDNTYNTTDKIWLDYFLRFNYAARRNR